MDALSGLHVHAHQQAVVARRADKARADVALVRPVVGEAAAFQGDVKRSVQTPVSQTEAASVGETGLAGVAGEVYGSAVSLLEFLQRWKVAQTSCH